MWHWGQPRFPTIQGLSDKKHDSVKDFIYINIGFHTVTTINTSSSDISDFLVNLFKDTGIYTKQQQNVIFVYTVIQLNNNML